MLKKQLLITALMSIMAVGQSLAQYSGSFIVQGNIANYYPVLIQDLAWPNNKATEFELGRSIIHTDGSLRGSLISKFRVHTTEWGHGSNFIDADIHEYNNSFIAGWADATGGNSNNYVIVWLKGGGTTYYFNSPVSITPIVCDGIANALPYNEPNGPSRTYKTSVDPYVNTNGISYSYAVYATGPSPNYFAGNVGIGTANPDQRLTVNGQVHATSVVVTSTVPADYVFNTAYYLRPLADIKTYVDKNHHLPDVPAAADFNKNGQNLGEMNMVLLRKVEELTRYMIEKDDEIKNQQGLINRQERRIERLEKRLSKK